jgi:hypothetical protein
MNPFRIEVGGGYFGGLGVFASKPKARKMTNLTGKLYSVETYRPTDPIILAVNDGRRFGVIFTAKKLVAESEMIQAIIHDGNDVSITGTIENDFFLRVESFTVS